MRYLSLVLAAAASLSPVVMAQNLTTTFLNNNGGAIGGGVYFDIGITTANGISITGLDVNVTGTGSIDVFTIVGTSQGFQTNQGAWTLSGTGTVTGGAPGIPAPVTLASPIALPAGNYGIAYRAVGVSHNYTNGTGTNQFYSNADLSITCGEASNTAFLAPLFTPRVVNTTIYYSPLGTGSTLATNTSVGQGCIRSYASFYELFAPGTFDLSNTTITWLNTGAGYTIVNAIPGTIVPPTPTAQVVAGGVLDGEQLFPLSAPMPIAGGTASALNVCTKGYIAPVAGNGINFSLSPSVFLAFPQTAWACWHDFDQSAPGSGDITFEEIGGIAYVTVNAVYTWLTTAPNTLQFQFDVATGTVTLVFGAYAGTSYPTLVGYSPGGPNLDPGSTDLSVVLGAGAIVLSSPEVLPLSLMATTRPITGTNWNLTTGNIPATGVIGLDILGLSNPNLPDLSFLVVPSCGLFASLDVMNAFLVAGSTHNWGLPIPANPSLLNVHVHAAAAVFQVPAVNAFGAITSNGIDGRVGDL